MPEQRWTRNHQLRRSRTPLLRDLTPEYDSEHHAIYVRLLLRAIKDRKSKARNIALSGTYGSGKSSILAKVASKVPRSITISLASMGVAKDGVASPYKTPDIQKEILKQLLYRVNPSRMPGSRFRRPSRRTSPRAAYDSLVAIGVLGVLLITAIGPIDAWNMTSGWSDRARTFGLIAATLLIGISLNAISKQISYRLRSAQLRAGPAQLDLGGKSEDYFEDWLDEIVYFFEVSRAKLVIFEDLDRFKDTKIFDDLRDLNSVINSARQIVRRRGIQPSRVQFVYAVRDSVFVEALNGEDSVNASIQRAKFFDLIVPVAPFMTAQSADTHLWTALRSVSLSVAGTDAQRRTAHRGPATRHQESDAEITG